MNAQRVSHGIEPVFDARSRVLVLGSFPSVASRETGFYYGHPQNRFWHVMAAALGVKTPETTEEKRAMLLDGGIALWDVIASCDIVGSSDASIRNAVPNDIGRILRVGRIERIITNGALAHRLYGRFLRGSVGMDDVPLPSTSPANARWTLEMLTEVWGNEINAVKRDTDR